MTAMLIAEGSRTWWDAVVLFPPNSRTKHVPLLGIFLEIWPKFSQTFVPSRASTECDASCLVVSMPPSLRMTRTATVSGRDVNKVQY